MKQVKANVLSNEELWGPFLQHGQLKFLSTRLMWLSCPEVAIEAGGGQFVMVKCGDECVLPRPFSIHQVDDDGNMALFFAVLDNGRGTGWLSQRRTSDSVSLFGPLGNGFSIRPGARNLLLVAGGNGIAPLYFLAQKALEKKYSVTLIYGTADNKRCRVPSEINTVASTEDGSVGHRGMATDLLPDFAGWADQIFACGPVGMYQTMAQMPELKCKPVQVSLEIMMGCGFGVCYGCTVKTRGGLKQVCRDGPVFDLEDILWGELLLTRP